MNATRSLFLSVGIHLLLAFFFFSAAMVADKTPPLEVEKNVVKIVLNPSQEAPSPPVDEPKHLTQEPLKAPMPLPVSQPQTALIPPKKERTIAHEPIPLQRAVPPPIAPAVESSAVAEIKTPPPSKIPEPAPHVAAKPTPQAPKTEKNYAEENLYRIRAILAERLKYPKNAVRLRQQGVCVVTFTLGSEREVSQIVVSESSGFDLLDDAAKTLIENSAADFPKPSKAVRISVPIEYKLR